MDENSNAYQYFLASISVDHQFKRGAFDVVDVIFSGPATIVLWGDDTKTVVKCAENDWYDQEKGIALCFMKKALGNKGKFNDILRECLEMAKGSWNSETTK